MATKDTDPVVPDTQPRTSQGEAASGLPGAVVFPYTTPVPAPTTNGANGYRWCHECQSVADVAGHECATRPPGSEHCADCGQSLWFMGANGVWEKTKTCDLCEMVLKVDPLETRAEFAESLLCAMAWDHGLDKRDHESHAFGIAVVEFYPLCAVSHCAFCDAERAYDAAHGGGR